MIKNIVERSSAPLRIDLSGGGTDLFGGKVISMAIDLRVEALLECTVKKRKRKRKDYKAFLEEWILHEHEHYLLDWSISPSHYSGLGGSAALAVAGVAVREGYFNLSFLDNSYDLAEMAWTNQRNATNACNGYQDEYTSAFGGLLYMDFSGKSPERTPGEPCAVVERLDCFKDIIHSVVVSIEEEHSADQLNRKLVHDYKHDPLTRPYIEALNGTTLITRRALIEQDQKNFFECIGANQEILRELGRSSTSADTFIETAKKHYDVKAAKVLGSGKSSVALFFKTEKDARIASIRMENSGTGVHLCKMDGGVRIED